MSRREMMKHSRVIAAYNSLTPEQVAKLDPNDIDQVVRSRIVLANWASEWIERGRRVFNWSE